MTAPAATLVFTWGNPSRGDDAIGPRVYDLLSARDPAGVDLLTDFQLQIEHVVDLENRERVLFVDADLAMDRPYSLSSLIPKQDSSYTTHAMSPGALLAVYEQVNDSPAPTSFLLKIRGYEFGLGLPLSAQALGNVAGAVDLIVDLITHGDTDSWLERCVTSGPGSPTLSPGNS